MKKWYQSKTIILNLIVFILGVLPLIDVEFLTAIGVTSVSVYLTVIGFVGSVLNMALRFMSPTQIMPLSFKNKKSNDGEA